VRALLALVVGALALAGCSRCSDISLPGSPAVDPSLPPQATHGVAAGDVDASSAVIWSRTDRAATMRVRVIGPAGERNASTRVDGSSDFTGKVVVGGLAPGSEHTYEVRFTSEAGGTLREGPPAAGTFRTAPAEDDARPVSFAWAGDVGGQNVCRDAADGYLGFAAIAERKVDFVLGVGDMIYADGVCDELGRFGNTQVPGRFLRSRELAGFWAHWRYNREDAASQRLLSRTAYFAVWDDHEVANDFGPTNPLIGPGLSAFLHYNPVRESPEAPKRLYRSVRWGKHLELYLLDTRQFRDPNSARDDGERPKTMLGAEQRAWLSQRLRAPGATWRVIVSSVTLSIPTGNSDNGRDGWSDPEGATGYERELAEVIGELRAAGIRRSVWIATDVHFATALRYRPFADDPAFQIYELVSGPLSAGLFPRTELDGSLSPERLFLFGPERSGAASLPWQEAKTWLNFGVVRVDAAGALTAEVWDVNGRRVWERVLTDG
jgi:alkaline phosphatase D